MTLADQIVTTPVESTREQNSPQTTTTGGYVNVGRNERKVSALAGGALALFGLSRRSLGGFALAGLGGALLYRGVSGHCHGYAALGIDTNDDAPPQPEEYYDRGIHVEHSVTVMKPRAELFR